MRIKWRNLMNQQETTMDDLKKLLADFCEYDNANIPAGLADEEGEDVIALPGPPVDARKGKRVKTGEETKAEKAATARITQGGRKKWALNEDAQRVRCSILISSSLSLTPNYHRTTGGATSGESNETSAKS